MTKYYEDPNILDDDVNYEESEIDIMRYVSRLFKNWKFVFKAGCVGVVVGLIFAISAVKSYTCSSLLAPEVTSKSGNSGLSSLASLAGVNLGSLSSEDALNPEIYPQIVNSLPFKLELLDTPITFTVGTSEELQIPLYSYLTEYSKKPWYSTMISLPQKVVYRVINRIKGIESDNNDYFPGCINPDQLTDAQSNIVGFLSNAIKVNIDKKTSLITVSATMGDPFVAKQVCDKVVSGLEEYVVAYRTEKSRLDVVYYQKLNEDAKNAYYLSQQKYAKYVDSNQGITRNSFLIESERLQNETDLAFQLYNQTSQQLQLAQAKIQIETPVCITIEPSTIPNNGEPSRAKILVIWTLLFCVFASIWALFEEEIKGVINSTIKGEDPKSTVIMP